MSDETTIEPLVERPGHQGQRTYPDNPGGYGNGHPPAGDPRKGGRPRKTPAGNEKTQSRELEPWREELMARARERLYARSTLALDDPTLNSIVQLTRDGNYPAVAAKSLGIPEATYKAWMQRGEEMVRTCEPSVADPDALQAELYLLVEEAEAGFETDIVADMKARIDGNKNWTGHMTILERRFPHRWGRRDVSAQNDEGIETRIRAYLQGRDDQAARAA